MALVEAPLDRLSPEHVDIVTKGSVEICEVNEGGQGKVCFEANAAVLCIRHAANKPPIRWLKNQKCADGAIVCTDDGEISLHLVELKKTVTEKKWEDIKLQFEGMLHNSLAILAVLGLAPPSKVLCHLAYENEKISPAKPTDPVLYKLLVGKSMQLGCSQEWSKSVINLSNYHKTKLVKVERNPVDGVGYSSL